MFYLFLSLIPSGLFLLLLLDSEDPPTKASASLPSPYPLQIPSLTPMSGKPEQGLVEAYCGGKRKRV